ncbi:SGNH/GDSL hydrolase family protein [Reyranella soli]|uniref:SGNH hydrolase-type esterase domain-containing protein n=1 Tax=Reyranella soli TaxID=1230389 RepID=A0A512NCR6_9HYPH|nr:SGNH/GDSL hydrolase family protein [Reyranella soli]GEP56739.1 hypothetical protein RSO01_39050 [Reyranella soli]
MSADTTVTTRNRWALAVIVNLAAAVVAVLCFAAWQQIQAPQRPTDIHGRFYQLADDVGYIPRANTRMTRSEVERLTFAHDVIYTTGPDHFRVTPGAATSPDRCVLVFGDSFSFGDGVADDETFAAQIVRQSQGRVAAYNFAVSGWGPQQFLAGLQSGRFQRSIQCTPTDAVFLMIPSLIWRSAGVTNPWDTNGPRYRLGADGRPVRDGRLGDPDPYNWRRWFGLPPVGKQEALQLATAVIGEAMAELKRLYSGIRTHFILYRVASWSDVDLTVDDLVSFEFELNKVGVMPLPLEAVIPRYRFAMDDYILSPTDHHPNARAHRLIAEFLLRQIKAAD